MCEQGTADGKRPGRFYVNVSNLHQRPKYEMVSLALHEGIPGHHLQVCVCIVGGVLWVILYSSWGYLPGHHPLHFFQRLGRGGGGSVGGGCVCVGMFESRWVSLCLCVCAYGSHPSYRSHFCARVLSLSRILSLTTRSCSLTLSLAVTLSRSLPPPHPLSPFVHSFMMILQGSLALEDDNLPPFLRFIEDRRYEFCPARRQLYAAYLEG